MNTKIVSNEKTKQATPFLVFLLTALCTFFYQSGWAQVSTYTFSESTVAYTPLATPSTAYGAPWDNHTAGAAFLAPLGFSFVYDGVAQNQCFISPNGFISFGIQPASADYLPLSTAVTYTNGGTISALGIDMISASAAATDNIV